MVLDSFSMIATEWFNFQYPDQFNVINLVAGTAGTGQLLTWKWHLTLRRQCGLKCFSGSDIKIDTKLGCENIKVQPKGLMKILALP